MKSADRGHTLRAIFKPRRAERKPFPAEKAWEAERARQLLSDASAQDQMDITAVEDEVCTGCGLEQWAWLGNLGKGYISDGGQYCCQGCADRRMCPCQG